MTSSARRAALVRTYGTLCGGVGYGGSHAHRQAAVPRPQEDLRPRALRPRYLMVPLFFRSGEKPRSSLERRGNCCASPHDPGEAPSCDPERSRDLGGIQSGLRRAPHLIRVVQREVWRA